MSLGIAVSILSHTGGLLGCLQASVLICAIILRQPSMGICCILRENTTLYARLAQNECHTRFFTEGDVEVRSCTYTGFGFLYSTTEVI